MLAPFIRSVNDWRFHGFVMFSLSLSKIGWILFCNAKETLQKMLARKCSYRYRGKHMKDWKQVLIIKSLKLPNFFFDIRLSMYWQNAFENWFGRQRSLRSRKDNPSMVDFRYNNNAIRNQKHFKPISNGNSSMIALTDEPLPCWKPKKKWKFKCKTWIKKLINCCYASASKI